MFKRLFALAVAVFMLLTFAPTFATTAEDVQTASAKADAFWDSMIAKEQEFLAEDLDKEEFTNRAFALYSTDRRVSQLERTESGFSFYVGSIPCVYDYEVRIHALTETEGAGLDEAVTIDNSTTRSRGKDVFLIGPYYGYQSSFTSYYRDLASSLSSYLGGRYTLLSGSEATGPAIKAYFAQAQDTDVIIFDSHGGASGRSSYLCLHTNSGLTSEDYTKGWAVNFSSGYYGIDGRYMTNGMTYTLNNSIVWAAICEGMMTTGLCNPFRQVGAGVVYGYSQSVSFTGDYEFAGVFWNAMMSGDTVAEAIAKMKQQYGDYDRYSSPRAYPVVVSDEDSYPSNPDSVQTVRSTWTLVGEDPVYYTVTFLDWDDTVLSEQTVEEGTAAIAPEVPEREGYTFTGWDTAFAYVQSDLTVRALYSTNSYKLTYYVNDEVYAEETHEYGEEITPLEAEMEGHTFSGWDAVPETMPAHDVDVHGTFEANTYIVTFLDADDNLIAKVPVKYGEAAKAPEAPEREGFVFAGWDGDISSVKSDMTVKALYDVQTFTVTFVNFDGTVLSEQTVNYGEDAQTPDTPERSGYVFIGWDTDFTNVLSDLTVTAKYVMLGDLNDDNIVNTADAVVLLKHAAEMETLDEVHLSAADVSRDSAVNTADATVLLKFAAGIITKF